MSRLRAVQYRCFASDGRLSMGIYADSLESAMRHTKIQISTFTPVSSFEKYANSAYVMRFLRYWHYPRMVSDVNADIHHVLDHGYAHLYPKLNAGKSCVTVHDLIPLLRWKGVIDNPDTKRAPRKPWLNLKSLSYIKRFDKVIAASHQTKADLIKYLQLPDHKIAVIPPVINSVYKPIDRAEVSQFAAKYKLDRSRVWIMISGREFYKNHNASLKTLKRLLNSSEYDFHLIKTGVHSNEFDDSVRHLGLTDRVTQIFLNGPEELALLYNFVDCVLFPSLYEGFGMPVAEALACGTPVVSSDSASLPEVGGKLSLRANSQDFDMLADKVVNAATDKEFCQMIRRDGPDWVQQFRAPVIARKYENLYSELAFTN